MNAKMTSSNLEALTVQNEEEIHTQVREYKALMPGTPQQGELLSPRQTEKASRRVLTAEQELTTRQKEGGNQAPAPPHTEASGANAPCAGAVPQPAQSLSPSPLPWKRSVLSTAISSQLLPLGCCQKGELVVGETQKPTHFFERTLKRCDHKSHEFTEMSLKQMA